MRDMTAASKILIDRTGTGEAGAPPFAAALTCCRSGAIPAMPAESEGD